MHWACYSAVLSANRTLSGNVGRWHFVGMCLTVCGGRAAAAARSLAVRRGLCVQPARADGPLAARAAAASGAGRLPSGAEPTRPQTPARRTSGSSPRLADDRRTDLDHPSRVNNFNITPMTLVFADVTVHATYRNATFYYVSVNVSALD